MKKILIVEDSQIVAKVLLHIARQELDFDILLAVSLAEAESLCDTHSEEIFAAIVDLNLPDAPNGEVVDYVLSRKIPTIVLTGSFDEKRREKLLSKGIVDYVAKEGRYSYQYAVRSINRLKNNQNIKVLVVEDSTTTRNYIISLLKRHQFTILHAVDGMDAIKVFLDNPDIRLLITDYNMPNMDGFELVRNIRCKYEKFDLVIIGLSAKGEGSLSARFIKTGANDFLSKPFNPEEFYCRINHNVESLQLVDQIRDAANRDYLTGVYSRRYFFEKSLLAYERDIDTQQPLALAVVSLDDFKAVNELYGQVVGDSVLQHFSRRFEKLLGQFLVARSTGKAFYVLMSGLPNEKAIAFLDKVRVLMASDRYEANDDTVSLSFSAGVSNAMGDCINDQIKSAEENLLRAKQAGKNIVIGDDDEFEALD